MRSIYLSPHQDDVGFSLGSLISKEKQGYLINIFNITDHLPSTPSFISQNDLRQYVSNIRDAEDRKFAELCELDRINLNFQDACLSLKNPFDLTGIQIEVEKVQSLLSSHLTALSSQILNEKWKLYCPMGIGGHRNHVATLLAIHTEYSKLQSHFNIYFYEDLPYAYDIKKRTLGLQQFNELFKGRSMQRYEMPLSTADALHKQALLESTYKSQLDFYLHAMKSSTQDQEIENQFEAIWVIR